MSEVTRLPKRSEVPLELTWDLTKIFATDAEFEEAFGQVVKAAEDFEQYKWGSSLFSCSNGNA